MRQAWTGASATYKYVDELLHAQGEDSLTPSLYLGVVDGMPQAAFFGESQEGIHLFRLAVVGGHPAAAEEVRLGAFVAEEEERRRQSSNEFVCRGGGLSTICAILSES